jgi:hypothetical protein
MKRFYVAATLLCAVLLGSLTILAQTQDWQKVEAAKRAEAEKALQPSAEERAKYASFLKSRDTGLTRLRPRERYDTEAYSPSMPRPAIRGGGAYYSFIGLTHEYGTSDLSLEQGHFRVGFAGANYGFLTSLGDVPLERVNLDTPAAKQLATYARVAQEEEARLEFARFGKGSAIGDVKVKGALPLQLYSTYLLRSVNYGSNDVLVAFKVVNIEADGSALILWKMLKQYSTPQLAGNN